MRLTHLKTWLVSMVLYLPCYSFAQTSTELESYGRLLNELSERRRINSFFLNEQSIFNGIQIGYVNASTGNLTFARRDLVVVGRIPIVIARIYDSTAGENNDFGLGWRLSIAETIRVTDSELIEYTDDSGSVTWLTLDGALAHPHESDIQSLERTSEDTWVLTNQQGWVRYFNGSDNLFQLTQIVDPNGNSLLLSYDDYGINRIEGANGRFVTFERDDSGKVRKIKDDQQRKVVFRYHSHGQLKSATDLGGRQWQYRYHPGGQLRTVIDANGDQALAAQYQTDGKVTRIKVRGDKYRYSYHDSVTRIRDQQDRITKATHNELGITTKLVNPQGFVSTLQLNEQNRVVQLKHNGNRRAKMTYDANGRIASLIRYDDTGQLELSYHYDWQDRAIRVHGNDDSSLILDYNHQGQLIQKTDRQEITNYSYAASGDLLQIEQNGHQVQYRYTGDGLIRHIQTDQGRTRLSYNNTGKLKKITFADGTVHEYQYDEAGFRSRTDRSNGSFLTYAYDAIGNLRSTTGVNTAGEPVGHLLTLDEDNKLVAVSDAQGNEQQFTYDPHGNPIRITRGDWSVGFTYDENQRLAAVTQDGQTSEYPYQERESDLRAQFDDRTMRVASTQVRQSATLGNAANTLYSRPYGVSWGVVGMVTGSNRLDLVNPYGMAMPDQVVMNSLVRRQMTGDAINAAMIQSTFDRPSNSIFLPPEYQTVNCIIGFCHIGWINLLNPGQLTVGIPSLIRATTGGLQGECLFGVVYQWRINNTFVPGGLNGLLSYSPTSPGNKRVDVTAECLCDGGVRHASRIITVAQATPSCSVAFDLTSPDQFTIDDTPSMPAINATVTSLSPANASVAWNAEVSFDSAGTCSGGPTFAATDTGTGMSFSPAFGGFYGGDLEVTATCSAPGYTSSSSTSTQNITATQPTDADIVMEIGTLMAPFDEDDLRRIGCQESNLTQFTNTGLPLRNTTGGDTGIMQICFQRDNEITWNWPENIARGRMILGTSRNSARNHLRAQRDNAGNMPAFTDDMWREESIHRYNAGTAQAIQYWVYDQTLDMWVIRPVGGVGGYVNNVIGRPDTCT